MVSYALATEEQRELAETARKILEKSLAPRIEELESADGGLGVYPMDVHQELVEAGYYNMDIAEASRCARMIGAKHTIPIHSSPTGVADPWLLWDEKTASQLSVPGRLLVRDGEEITL